MRNVMAARSLQCRRGAGKLYEIEVNAATQYLADQSDESAGRYVFAYTIVHNTGAWRAAHQPPLDHHRRAGPGAGGARPRRGRRAAAAAAGRALRVHERRLDRHPVGTMRGYQMVAADGTRFEAPIPEFTLSVPRVLH